MAFFRIDEVVHQTDIHELAAQFNPNVAQLSGHRLQFIAVFVNAGVRKEFTEFSRTAIGDIDFEIACFLVAAYRKGHSCHFCENSGSFGCLNYCNSMQISRFSGKDTGIDLIYLHLFRLNGWAFHAGCIGKKFFQ